MSWEALLIHHLSSRYCPKDCVLTHGVKTARENDLQISEALHLCMKSSIVEEFLSKNWQWKCHKFAF